MSSGKVTIDREALKSQIKRIKLASAAPEADVGEKPAKVRKVAPKATRSKGVTPRPRGRPPGALNKKTLAKIAARPADVQIAQAMA